MGEWRSTLPRIFHRTVYSAYVCCASPSPGEDSHDFARCRTSDNKSTGQRSAPAFYDYPGLRQCPGTVLSIRTSNFCETMACCSSYNASSSRAICPSHTGAEHVSPWHFLWQVGYELCYPGRICDGKRVRRCTGNDHARKGERVEHREKTASGYANRCPSICSAILSLQYLRVNIFCQYC